MMVELQRARLPRWRPSPILPIAKSLPFVESRMGRYTHRVRCANLGMSFCISERKGRFVEEPSPGYVVCATCEGRAIGAGQLGAREIAGREVMFAPRRTAWADVVRMRSLNTLQANKGREQHLCPLPFDIVDRAITQFSMAGETVFDPFAGLGTVPYCAIKRGRKGIGIELASTYFLDACAYCKAAEREQSMPSLFDTLPEAKAA
jgi:hypothetical protein